MSKDIRFLNKKEVEDLGLKAYTSDEIIREIDNGSFNKIAVLKIGHYLDQSMYTIFATKQYDIAHNTMEVNENEKYIKFNEIKEGKKGICFWSYKGKDTSHYRNFLSNLGDDKGSKYLIMPYTLSSNNAGDYDCKANIESSNNIDDFFVKMKDDFNMNPERYVIKYAWDDKTEKYPYPNSMFPAVVEKNHSNCAFLISEFGYFDIKDFPRGAVDMFKYFKSIPQKGEEKELNDSVNHGNNSKAVAMLHDEYKDSLKEYFNQFKTKELQENDKVYCYVAKLEYPYVIFDAE